MTEVEIDEPGAGEALVKIVATGVCHTDALARDGDMPFPAPGGLGHEGAGIAGSRADGTTALRRLDGSPLHSHFFGQSSFASYSICAANALVRVDPDADIALLGPLACGIATGAGAVLNALRPFTGSSIVIYGAGAVGLSAVMAARLTPAIHIIAVDRLAARLTLAGELGATETIDVSTGLDPVVTVSEICGGPADFALDCAGNLNALRQAGDSIGMRGTLALIGGAPAGASFAMDHQATLWGKKVVGILGGEGRSESLINTLITLNKQGRFPYDRLLQTFPLDQVNEALEASHRGDVIKPVLRRPEGVPGRAPVLLLPPQRRTPRNIASHAIAWSRISWVCLLVIYAMLAPICDDSLT